MAYMSAGLLSTGAPKRIGFIPTIFQGTDDLTLKARKWAHLLGELGHTYHCMAGLLEPPPELSHTAPPRLFQPPRGRRGAGQTVWRDVPHPGRHQPNSVTQRTTQGRTVRRRRLTGGSNRSIEESLPLPLRARNSHLAWLLRRTGSKYRDSIGALPIRDGTAAGRALFCD